MPKQQIGGNQHEPTSSGERLTPETMKRFQDQIRSTLEPFVQDIKKLSEANLNGLIQNLQSIQSSQGQISPEAIKTSNISGSTFNPPIPLPLAHNDWSKIKEGYSYTYSSKIPVEMKDLDDDIGFDVLRARYVVAALQLQNIESLKMLKEKQKN